MRGGLLLAVVRGGLLGGAVLQVLPHIFLRGRFFLLGRLVLLLG